MAGRKLSDEETSKLGLGRKLSDDEAQSTGLEAPQKLQFKGPGDMGGLSALASGYMDVAPLGHKASARAQAIEEGQHDKTGQDPDQRYERDLKFQDEANAATEKAHPYLTWTGRGVGVAAQIAAGLAAGPASKALGYAPSVAAKFAPGLGGFLTDGAKAVAGAIPVNAAFGAAKGFDDARGSWGDEAKQAGKAAAWAAGLGIPLSMAGYLASRGVSAGAGWAAKKIAEMRAAKAGEVQGALGNVETVTPHQMPETSETTTPEYQGKPSIEAIIARNKQINSRMAEVAAAGPKPSSYDMPTGGRAVVSPDASKPGRWRVTRLDEDGVPVGHAEASDHIGALKVAREFGVDFGVPKLSKEAAGRVRSTPEYQGDIEPTNARIGRLGAEEKNARDLADLRKPGAYQEGADSEFMAGKERQISPLRRRSTPEYQNLDNQLKTQIAPRSEIFGRNGVQENLDLPAHHPGNYQDMKEYRMFGGDPAAAEVPSRSAMTAEMPQKTPGMRNADFGGGTNAASPRALEAHTAQAPELANTQIRHLEPEPPTDFADEMHPSMTPPQRPMQLDVQVAPDAHPALSEGNPFNNLGDVYTQAQNAGMARKGDLVGAAQRGAWDGAKKGAGAMATPAAVMHSPMVAAGGAAAGALKGAGKAALGEADYGQKQRMYEFAQQLLTNPKTRVMGYAVMKSLQSGGQQSGAAIADDPRRP